LGAIVLFSGDQLHATIPNTTDATRYSIDFRTVDLTDGADLDDDLFRYDTEGAEGLKVHVPQ
jgi:ectoine hydroxylase-related dioxygenase (phytanoyl-CoA dioxygenase family)